MPFLEIWDYTYDDCEKYYTAGLEEWTLLGGQNGDANGDGNLDFLNTVYFMDVCKLIL